MEKIHILGTGNAMVTNCYNTCFAIGANEQYFLVDAGGGNGILKQLAASDIQLEAIPEMFVSHCHIDHILGVIWLIRAFGAKAAKNPKMDSFVIYGHEGVIKVLNKLMKMLLNKKQSEILEGRLKLVTVEDGETIETMGMTLQFVDKKSTKDQQFGCKFTLASGKTIMFLGDEPYREHEYELAKGVDYLLHEAFCLYGDREIYEPYKKHHATVKEACENAATLGVKNILMYHTEDNNIRERKATYSYEGKEYFEGGILVPDDLDVIIL